jgi:hypothetical protein
VPSTASYTAQSYSTSTATATDSATTKPAPTHSDAPPPETANHYADHASQVRKFDEHTWGNSVSAVRSPRDLHTRHRRLQIGCDPGRIETLGRRDIHPRRDRLLLPMGVIQHTGTHEVDSWSSRDQRRGTRDSERASGKRREVAGRALGGTPTSQPRAHPALHQTPIT